MHGLRNYKTKGTSAKIAMNHEITQLKDHAVTNVVQTSIESLMLLESWKGNFTSHKNSIDSTTQPNLLLLLFKNI